ncbi:MAG: beta-ketoacyl-ACP synthase II [Parachlamydiales bacterium]
MKRRRVVITGMGLTSCFGSDPDHFYDQLLAGKSGVNLINEFQTDDLPTKFAAWVSDFDPEGYVEKKQLRRADPYINFILYAGKRAAESAGLTGATLEALDRRRCGVLIGSGMGGMKMYHEGVATLHDRGVRRVTPFFVPYIITNMGSGLLATDLDFRGPNYSISTACATGAHSVISAANHIRVGDADVMICGGCEATQNRITIAGFVALHALSERNETPQKASRPWCKTRDGFVLGEGCGVLVLEELEHALKRGAPILGEYLGGAVNCDAYHMTNIRPDGSGITDCINLAIDQAGIDRKRINYVNAHATSTPMGDMAEVAGIRGALPEDTRHVKMNGTKSMIGHALGGAAALELIVTLKAIERNRLHPTINIEDPEEVGIDTCRGGAVDHQVDVALKNSFGFGGHNAAILLSGYRK